MSVVIDGNVRCNRVYPSESTKKSIKDLKSIGLRLTKDQAVHLARVLLAVAQEWDDIEVTAYRFEKRKTDGSYPITITSFIHD